MYIYIYTHTYMYIYIYIYIYILDINGHGHRKFAYIEHARMNIFTPSKISVLHDNQTEIMERRHARGCLLPWRAPGAKATDNNV